MVKIIKAILPARVKHALKTTITGNSNLFAIPKLK